MKNKNINSFLSKVPPNDIDIEQQVLGHIILFPENLAKVKAALGNTGKETFYNEQLKLLYEVLLKMEEKQIPIGIVTVRSFIKENLKGKIPCTFAREVTDTDIVIPQTVFDYQLLKLKELWARRYIQNVNLEAFQALNDGADAEEVKQHIISVLAEVETGAEKEKSITLAELLKMELPRTPYLIGKGLLPREGYTMITGAKKQRKTTLALYFTICLASGIPIFMSTRDKPGLFPIPEKGKSLFLFRENTLNNLKKIGTMQIRGLEKLLHRKIEEETWESIKLLWPKGVWFDTKSGKRELERIIKSNPTDLVIIDPLSKFMTKDINKMEVVSKITNFLGDLSRQYRCAFLLVHHERKPQAGERPELEDPFYRATGSAGLVNSMESGLAMKRKSKQRSEIIMEISFEFRNEKTPDPITIRVDPENLLFEPITTEEFLEGASSLPKLVELIRREFPRGVSPNLIRAVASERFGVTKERISELLRKGKDEGKIGQETKGEKKYYVL